MPHKKQKIFKKQLNLSDILVRLAAAHVQITTSLFKTKVHVVPVTIYIAIF